jgi:hypothetical protein
MYVSIKIFIGFEHRVSYSHISSFYSTKFQKKFSRFEPGIKNSLNNRKIDCYLGKIKKIQDKIFPTISESNQMYVG